MELKLFSYLLLRMITSIVLLSAQQLESALSRFKMVDISFCQRLFYNTSPLPAVLKMKTRAWAPKRGGKCSGRSTPTHPRHTSFSPFRDWSAGREKKKSLWIAVCLNRLAQEQECWSEDLRICFRCSGKLLLNRIFLLMFPHVGRPAWTEACQLNNITSSSTHQRNVWWGKMHV